MYIHPQSDIEDSTIIACNEDDSSVQLCPSLGLSDKDQIFIDSSTQPAILSYFVYIHRSPSIKCYVGITQQIPKKRWLCGNGYKNNTYFQRAIDKYGWKSFTHEVIYSNITKEDAEAYEKQLIEENRSNQRKYGYNIQNGGSAIGKHSEETKIKIRNGNLGKQVSTETRRRSSEAHMGYLHSDETKMKLAIISRGRRATDDTKKIMSENNKGKKLSDETKRRMSASKNKSVMQKTDEGIVVATYLSQQLAEQQTGIKQSNISSSCLQKAITAGGYMWQYKDDNISNPRSNKRKRVVEQLLHDGTVVAHYDSMTDAQRKTGIGKANIWDTCNGHQKTAGDYSWRYSTNP